MSQYVLLLLGACLLFSVYVLWLCSALENKYRKRKGLNLPPPLPKSLELLQRERRGGITTFTNEERRRLREADEQAAAARKDREREILRQSASAELAAELGVTLDDDDDFNRLLGKPSKLP